jgi:hypothetical protein
MKETFNSYKNRKERIFSMYCNVGDDEIEDPVKTVVEEIKKLQKSQSQQKVHEFPWHIIDDDCHIREEFLLFRSSMARVSRGVGKDPEREEQEVLQGQPVARQTQLSVQLPTGLETKINSLIAQEVKNGIFGLSKDIVVDGLSSLYLSANGSTMQVVMCRNFPSSSLKTEEKDADGNSSPEIYTRPF